VATVAAVEQQRPAAQRKRPLATRRRDADGGAEEELGAALRLVRFPEALEILADSFEADLQRRAPAPQPADAGHQVEPVTLTAQGALEADVGDEGRAGEAVAGRDAGERDAGALPLAAEAN